MRLRWPSLKYAWLPWLIIAMAVIVFSVGALGFHYMESRLVMSKWESLALASGTLISALIFVVLIWSTRRLLKEWVLVQQEHAKAAKAESKYSALLESTEEGIYSIDKEGRLTFINKAGAAALGFSSQELLGRPMHVIHHHSHADGSPYSEQDCPIYQAFRNNQGCRVDTEVFWRQDGTPFPVEYASYSLFDKEGSSVGAVVTFTDITERKRTEEALRQSEVRFKTVVRATNDVVWEWNFKTNALWWGDNFFTLFGYRPDEVEPGVESWSTRLHPDEKDRIVSDVDAAIQHKQQFWSGEYRFRRADGSYAYVYDRGYIHLDESGIPVRMTGAVMDITERKRAEESLRASERMLRTVLKEREQLVQDLHDGIIQSLYAIGMSIEECRRLVEEDPEKARLKLGQEVSDVNAVIRAVRSHLVQCEEDTPFSARQFKAELTRVAGTMERANALHFRLKVDQRAAERLTSEERREILYIAQETMSNCLRHSGAAIANISLRLARDHVHLEVEDDGMGFDTKTLHEKSGGLHNIEQRAAKIGAKMEIESHREHGTRIRLDMPIHR